MKLFSIRNLALALGILMAAVLPVAAIGLQDEGQRLAPNQDIVDFFVARGVDAQYVGKSQSEVPAAQWKIMADIANTMPDDFTNPHADYTDYLNAHDELNSMVTAQLAGTVADPNKPVYISIGGIVWSAQIEE